MRPIDRPRAAYRLAASRTLNSIGRRLPKSKTHYFSTFSSQCGANTSFRFPPSALAPISHSRGGQSIGRAQPIDWPHREPSQYRAPTVEIETSWLPHID